MSRRLAIGLLIGVGVAAAAFVTFLGLVVPGFSTRPAPDVSELDPILTSFQLDTLDGSRLGPPDLRGDVVVVDIWATWCKPCDVQAKILEGLHAEYADQGVTFLALNTGEDLETVQKHVDEKPFGYPVLLDPEEEVMRGAELSGLPTLLVLNPLGEVSYISVGLTGASVVRGAIEEARAVGSG
jgi:thiol-disulfide isomerase/thioredoxin